MDDTTRQNRLYVLVAIIIAVFIGARVGYQTDADIRAAFDGILGIATQQAAKLLPEPKQADGGATKQAAAPEKPEPKEEVTGPAVPELDIVRVEPSGDAVFAGKVEPGWDVELRANGEAIGSAKAGGTGEWAIVIDKPLNTGASDITLHATSPDGAMTVNAPDRVAVDISETRKAQPLVVVTSPDTPSDIVQAPETQIAENTGIVRQTPDAAPVLPDAAPALPDAVPALPDATPALKADEKPDQPAQVTARAQAPVPAQAPAPAQAAVQPPGAETAQDAKPGPDTGSVGLAQDQQPQKQQKQQPGKETTRQAALPDKKPDAPAQQTAQGTSAAGDDEVKPQEQVQALVKPLPEENTGDGATDRAEIAIEVVEKTEKEQLFVSGSANPGDVVRAYSDNVAIGDAVADAAGKWRISGSGAVAGDGDAVTIRADGLDTGTGQPWTRAEVRFDSISPGETVITLMPVPEERASSPDPAYDRLIVQRGDNLWRIARKIYGEGVRFTNIYNANQIQIRDPDLIYPGQVFAVPKGILRQGDTAG